MVERGEAFQDASSDGSLEAAARVLDALRVSNTQSHLSSKMISVMSLLSDFFHFPVRIRLQKPC